MNQDRMSSYLLTLLSLLTNKRGQNRQSSSPDVNLAGLLLA